jgi:hypothetical protein
MQFTAAGSKKTTALVMIPPRNSFSLPKEIPEHLKSNEH